MVIKWFKALNGNGVRLITAEDDIPGKIVNGTFLPWLMRVWQAV
jgi:hypothetical protein